jgi:anti-sigma regulatory factor (Ser/Thr protein kinase)
VPVSAQGVELGKLRLPTQPTAPKIARDLVNAVIRAAGVDEDVAFRARIATSELVTNALRHGIPGDDVSVGIRRMGDLLHIVIADTSPDVPQFCHPQELAESGYGLLLVGDITDDCGYRVTKPGKEVWFSLKAEWPADAAASRGVSGLGSFLQSGRSGAVCIATVSYGVDLDGMFVFVDSIDDPIGAAPGGVVAVEGFIQRLADSVWAGRDRPVDGFHGGDGDV